MKQSETNPAALTSRDIPAPLGVCAVCGETPAVLELDGHDHRCPACHVRALLETAAGDHLRKLLTPILGVWADHWTRAGLTPDTLTDVLEYESGAWRADPSDRRTFLRDLLEHHRPPTYREAGPDRVTVHLEQLPTLADRVTATYDGECWPVFTTWKPDGTPGQYPEAPGLDMLTLELPDGLAVLLPLGMDGRLDLPRGLKHAVHIPPHLREQARAVYHPRHAPPHGGQQ